MNDGGRAPTPGSIYIEYCRELCLEPSDALRLVFNRGFHAGFAAGLENERHRRLLAASADCQTNGKPLG